MEIQRGGKEMMPALTGLRFLLAALALEILLPTPLTFLRMLL